MLVSVCKKTCQNSLEDHQKVLHQSFVFSMQKPKCPFLFGLCNFKKASFKMFLVIDASPKEGIMLVTGDSCTGKT